MKWDEMKPSIAYKVIKGSSDGTFVKDDIIWLSQNGYITGSYDFLKEEEWNRDCINDFEVEESTEYHVFKYNDMEGIQKNEKAEFFVYKERWDELKTRLEKAELELLNLVNKNISDDFNRNRLNSKISGLRIALEYMREIES